MSTTMVLLKVGNLIGLVPLCIIVFNLPAQFEIFDTIGYLNWFHLGIIGFVLSFICYALQIRIQPNIPVERLKIRHTILLIYIISTPILTLVYFYMAIIEGTDRLVAY